jgi:archaellum component FlaF (FlaF/FlaG flagellin family)
MADSLRQNYVLESVADDRVEIQYKGQQQLHQFNFNAPGSNFLTNLSLTNCFSNIELTISSLIISKIPICMWAYPFDYFVEAANPIGRERGTFDLGEPLDQGLPFDSDPVDPYNDGWVGYSLSGRFEQDVANSAQAKLGLDSFVTPALSYTGSQCVYINGPYMQLFNSSRADIEVDYLVTASGSIDTYTPGALSGLSLELPVPTPVMQAGTAYPAVVKFSDQYGMSVPGATGGITVQESDGGASSVQTVTTNGYESFNLVPTKVGQTYWSLSSGSLSGQSATATVIAGPFAAFNFASIADQAVGVPFTFAIQAVDQYGNPVTDTGADTKVSILTTGFVADSITPNYIELTNGAGTVQLTITEAGTGQLQFQIGSVITNSNTFCAS